MAASQELLELIANSKTGDEITTAETLQDTDYLFVYVSGVGFKKIQKSKIAFAGEPATKLTDLSDTPSTLLGQKGKILVVSQDEKSFEYKVLAEVTGVTAQELADAISQVEADLLNHETRIQALEAAGPSSPVDGTYANITALIADQNNQLEDFIYEVLDASDNGVTGKAYYFYNGTTAGTMEDYTSLTAQEVADLTAQAIIDALGYTPADDEDLVPFTTITENEHGTHPAFTDQHSFNVWVLQNIGGSEPTPEETLNTPELFNVQNLKADENRLSWTDTNS